MIEISKWELQVMGKLMHSDDWLLLCWGGQHAFNSHFLVNINSVIIDDEIDLWMSIILSKSEFNQPLSKQSSNFLRQLVKLIRLK